MLDWDNTVSPRAYALRAPVSTTAAAAEAQFRRIGQFQVELASIRGSSHRSVLIWIPTGCIY